MLDEQGEHEENDIGDEFNDEEDSFVDYVEEYLSEGSRYKNTNMYDPNQSELYWMTQDDFYESDFDTLIKLFGEYFKKETNGKTYTIKMGSRYNWYPDSLWTRKVRYTQGKPEILEDSTDENEEMDDHGDGDIVYYSNDPFEESFKSKDKYSTLREALEILDREDRR